MRMRIKPFRWIADRFLNMKISHKILFGYIITIFVPFIAISMLFYWKSANSLFLQYQYNQKVVMDTNFSDFQVKISQIENISNIFQYNTPIIQFLSGYEDTKEEEVLSYLGFRSMFIYASNMYNSIDKVTIYRKSKGYANFASLIKNPGDLPDYVDINKNTKEWVYSPGDNLFKYYITLYNQTSYYDVGILEISIKPSAFFRDFTAKQDAADVFTVGGHLVYCSNGDLYQKYLLTKGSNNPQASGKYITFSREVPNMNLNILRIQNYKDSTSTSFSYMYAVIILLLLGIISLIYYFITFSFSGRILKLSTHISRKCTDTNLTEFDRPDHLDEVGILISTFNKMVRRINNLIENNYKAEILRKTAEFQALQSQINPHFLNNTLECVRMTAEANNDEEVSNMIYTLSKYMRYNITRKPDFVLLSNELKNIARYFNLIKFRKEDKFYYNIDVQCDIEEVICPFFILQPIVENSVVHGMIAISKALQINITISEEQDFLFIRVEDNGIGIKQEQLGQITATLDGSKSEPPAAHAESGSVGLENVHQRLKHFYGEQCGLTIQSQYGKGVVCLLKIMKKVAEKA